MSIKTIVGMIVAVELDAVIRKYGEKLVKIPHRAFDIHSIDEPDRRLIIVNSGAGEIASAAAAQLLISEFHADMIVNFGVVGGLTPEMKVAKLCVVESVVHYDFDASDFRGCPKCQYSGYDSIYIPTDERLLSEAVRVNPMLKRVVCASGDKFIGSNEAKRALHTEFNADICEMEAAGIVLTANRNGVPCLLIKAVSDAMDGGAEEFAREIDRCALICLDTLDTVIKSLFSAEG